MIYFGHPVINPFRNHVPVGFYDKVKGHTGIDLATPIGTELSLPIETKVEIINKQVEMGLTLYLSDKKGNILVFAHLEKIKPKLGDKIKPDEVFALTGNSGTRTTGPHCHFEIIASKPEPGLKMMTRDLSGFTGYNIDPVKYLDSILTPHWSDESMEWMIKHEIIGYKRDPDESVTWAELAVVSNRLAKKIIEWVKPISDN